MAKGKEESAKKTYTVLRNLRHNMKHYAPQSMVELTDEEAAELPKGTVEVKIVPEMAK